MATCGNTTLEQLSEALYISILIYGSDPLHVLRSRYPVVRVPEVHNSLSPGVCTVQLHIYVNLPRLQINWIVISIAVTCDRYLGVAISMVVTYGRYLGIFNSMMALLHVHDCL